MKGKLCPFLSQQDQVMNHACAQDLCSLWNGREEECYLVTGNKGHYSEATLETTEMVNWQDEGRITREEAEAYANHKARLAEEEVERLRAELRKELIRRVELENMQDKKYTGKKDRRTLKGSFSPVKGQDPAGG